jgi:uncharacterized membrane protein
VAESEQRLAESTRLEAFSDGVFAIALTLLVLDLHAPTGEAKSFSESLADEWPVYLAYLSAFLNIAAIWVHHHEVFARVRRVDVRLLCLNLVLLLVASLFPWPASVISAAVRHGTHADLVTACLLYAGVGLLVPVAWIPLYRYLEATPQLLASPGDKAFMHDGAGRALVSLAGYPLAGALALFAPIAAVAVYALIPVFFLVTLLVPKPETA